MERVAFLVERSGERIPCLLNPEHVVVRRLAGVRPRQSIGGLAAGAGLADDPVFYTGGGTTELRLDLLFDVSLAPAGPALSTTSAEDVRTLTAPLWRLAENATDQDPYGRPPLVRFVWGKTWNIPGVIAAVAERLEYFTTGGAPRRSWMRIRFLRVADVPTREPISDAPARDLRLAPEGPPAVVPSAARVHVVSAGERLDAIAHRYYGQAGHPSLWRWLAAYNGLSDPLNIPPGFALQIPPLSDLETPR